MILSKIKIPTVLGLALLLVASFLAVAIYLYNSELNKKNYSTFSPKEVKVVNIAEDKATIIWQTDIETETEAVISSSNMEKIQKDDRDGMEQRSRLTHFVTFSNLKEDTTYNLRIKSGNFYYPDTPITFKTALKLSVDTDGSLNKPIIGKVIEPNLEPSKDAIILLEIPNATAVATTPTTAGNFILSLSTLRSTDLSTPFILKDRIDTALEVKKSALSSHVKIVLPSNAEPLPPIILGQNSDFTSMTQKKIAKENNYDLNNDNKVNSVDLSISVFNLGKKGNNPADVNGDKVVDEKDIELIKQALQ